LFVLLCSLIVVYKGWFVLSVTLINFTDWSDEDLTDTDVDSSDEQKDEDEEPRFDESESFIWSSSSIIFGYFTLSINGDFPFYYITLLWIVLDNVHT
jgi:hypothetical protein